MQLLLDGKTGSYTPIFEQYQAKAEYFLCAALQKNNGPQMQLTPGWWSLWNSYCSLDRRSPLLPKYMHKIHTVSCSTEFGPCNFGFWSCCLVHTDFSVTGGMYWIFRWNNMQYVTSAAFLLTVAHDYYSAVEKQLSHCSAPVENWELLAAGKAQVCKSPYPRDIHSRFYQLSPVANPPIGTILKGRKWLPNAHCCCPLATLCCSIM